jgi:putative transcriptional regulator
MAVTNRKSRILDEMHDTARGLHRARLIDKRRMREFDALCSIGVEPLSPQIIKELREQENLSQTVFAVVLNTSVSTVQKWEIGDRKPSGPSLKLLNLIKCKGLESVL